MIRFLFVMSVLVLGNGVSMKFALIPAGTFKMGSGLSVEQTDRKYGRQEFSTDDEYPQHTVKLTKAFYMGVTEVTQSQWRSMMGTSPWSGKAHARDGANDAASYVSWNDATAFCKKMSARTGKAIRLPTEAEWEYACRAGSTTAHHFGNDAGQLGRYAWYGRNAYGKGEDYAHAVGRKLPNGWGLYDMHGNVCEWCRDWYKEDYPTAMQMDPKGPASGRVRVLHGGSWHGLPRDCLSADRDMYGPDDSSYRIGFRVVVSSSAGLD